MTNKLTQELESYIRSIVRDELNAAKQPDKSKLQTLIEPLLPSHTNYKQFLDGNFWVKIPIHSSSIKTFCIGRNKHSNSTPCAIAIEFKNSPGTFYRYHIPEEVANEWISNKRPGSFFVSKIRDNYKAERLFAIIRPVIS